MLLFDRKIFFDLLDVAGKDLEFGVTKAVYYFMAKYLVLRGEAANKRGRLMRRVYHLQFGFVHL